MILRNLLLMVLTVGLAGCAGLVDRDDTEDLREPAGRSLDIRDDDGLVMGQEDEDEETFDETEIFPGTGRFYDEEAASRRPDYQPVEDGEITLNFEGTGIQEVVHALLGHFLEENYVIAPGVSGEVTFSTARAVNRDQIMPILEMLLGWNGATLIWREGRYHVLPVSDAVRGNLVPRLAQPDQIRGYEVIAVPLEYISPGQMAELLEPYAKDGGVFDADNARGLLFMGGTRYELSNYLQIIQTFDVDWLAGMSIGMFSLERVEVGEIAAELESVFGEGADTPLAGMFRFVPMERLNAMMVITPQEHYLREAERWIERLDRASTGAGSRLYVYRVKNLEADILAGYLADLFGTGQTGTRRREQRGGVSPGLEEARASSVGDFQRQQQDQQRSGQQQQQQRGGQSGVSLGDGDIRITAVLETNSLLIQASPQEYDSILNAIKRLDEEPLQVLIEAQVVEVALTENLRLGVSWFLANTHPDAGGPSLPGSDNGGPIFDRSRSRNRMQFGQDQDFFSTFTRRGLDRTFITGFIEALDNETDTRTLSTPSLMVRNNAEARINVGQQVPVQSQRIIGGIGDGRPIGSAQYVNTGTILEVTPRVNPGGLVYLRVRQEISSPGERPDDGGNPPITNREVSTEVAVQSGQTIVLGGLISENTSIGESGLPGFRRIPLIGPLFGRRSESMDRTETLVLITPTVIDSSRTLEEVSDEFQKKFRGLEPMRGFRGNRSMGSDD